MLSVGRYRLRIQCSMRLHPEFRGVKTSRLAPAQRRVLCFGVAVLSRLALMWSSVCRLAACTPSLNWREAAAPGAGATLLFPCRPDRVARKVRLAEVDVDMVLMSCSAGGATYALSHAEFSDPAQASLALRQLQVFATDNLGGSMLSRVPYSVPGMTPSALAQRVQIAGRRADGSPVHEQAVFFVKGLRVFQASIVGDTVDGQAADIFFSGLKLPA